MNDPSEPVVDPVADNTPTEISTAESLFGSDSPVETPATETPITGSTVEPVEPVVEVAPVQPAPAAQVQPAAPAVVTPATPAPVVLTAEQLEVAKRMFEPAAPAVAAPAQTQQPVARPSLSDPTVRQQLGIYDLTEADYDGIFAEPDKTKSMQNFNAVLQKVATQAVTMANVLVRDAQERIKQTFSPYTQFADEQREQMLQYEFFTKHPDLQGQQQILQFVQKQMVIEGYKPASKEEGFDEVAKRTKDLIAQFATNGQQPVQGTPAATTQGQQSAPAQKPTMAVLGRGNPGGGSAGAQTSASGGSSTARNIFG